MIFSSFEEIAALCRERAPEALQLEFKEKGSADHPELDNGDKKVIAKAVSALANSGGGTLVLGIRTKKVGELDLAAELRPIVDPELCRAQVEFVCKNNVSPEIVGLHVAALTGPDGDGVIVCQVPPSERRPHMSTAPGVHSYYRRTFQGNVPMTPFEVQEQVLAVRAAVLCPTVTVSRGASISSKGHWVTLQYGIEFGLKNIGSRAALNPFLRVRSSEHPQTYGATYDNRLGMWKSDAPFGTIIHVDDSRKFFVLQFIARVFASELVITNDGVADDLLNAVHLYGGEDDLHAKTVTDKKEIQGLTFAVNYGG